MNDLELAARHFAAARLCYRWALTLMVLAFALLAGTAFAQEAAPAAASDVDVLGLLAKLLDAVENGNWWLAAGPALTLAVLGLKKFDQDIPRVGPAVSRFMDQPAVSFVLPTVLSGATGLFGSLATGLPIGPALLAALKVSMSAIFTYVGAKKVAEQAKAAGDAAAAKVETKASAVDVINKL